MQEYLVNLEQVANSSCFRLYLFLAQRQNRVMFYLEG